MYLERYDVGSLDRRERFASDQPSHQGWRKRHNRKTVVSHAQVVTSTIKAREMQTFRLSFSEWRLSSLTAWGEGTVDLYVFDQDGELVAFDDGADKQSHCAWLASPRADYMVWVVNNERQSIACSVALQTQ